MVGQFALTDIYIYIYIYIFFFFSVVSVFSLFLLS